MSPKQDLRSALVKKLGNPSHVQLHRLAEKVRERYGPLTPQDCYAILAHENGLRLHRFLQGDELDRITRMIAAQPATPTSKPATRRRKRAKKAASVNDSTDAGDPILPQRVLQDAERMAEVYPLTYRFENSVREVVVRVMQAKHGVDWWMQPMVPAKVLRDVEKTKKNEEKMAWHGARGKHQIHYTSIENLNSIITCNDNWELFEPILGEQNAVSYLIQIIEHSRHTIAHHNPLGRDDIRRLKMNIDDWQKMLKEKRHLIPG